MTKEQVIEEKYKRIFITLFDIMTFDRFLMLKRMKEKELSELNQKK